MKRRDFLKQAAGAAATGLPYIMSRYAQAQSQNAPLPEQTLTRDEIAEKLRSRIRNLLDNLERKTGLEVEFRPLDRDFGVGARQARP